LTGLSVNGKPVTPQDFTASPQQLEVRNLPRSKMFKLEVRTQLAPAENKKLMGLYQSNGVYCTQCEAEGFRRITYFLDRPDILAVYTVRLEADRKLCPMLLSNGNPVKKGRLAKGRHFAIWHDPHPKPSYLFALVGGDLDVFPDKFKTASGRRVALNIFVEKGKADSAAYAMDALKRSMKWDEEVYGCEYDLDVFNIVAVSDFNMGAMENKGLNVFNDKYVLADPEAATDADYMHIEAIIAHEYFHNWTGNRITCRDWFQLCLKEGLTVYRDQEFSADQRSRPVQRIQQVRGLKAAQFPEDAGPLAHSVRPDAYREINNFYTATVYQKGAELVRMLATLVGPEAYRRSTDLYFKNHDGRAAIVEDWLDSFEQGSGTSLAQFAKWYQQAGTPRLTVKERFNRREKTFTLMFRQSISPTPGQAEKFAVPIPVRFGFMNVGGDALELNSTSDCVRGDVIVVDREELSVEFHSVTEKPIASLLRGFSAPVVLDMKVSDAARLARARHDSDLYNRWEALNGYAIRILLTNSRSEKPRSVKQGNSNIDPDFVQAVTSTAFDDSLDPAFRAQVLTLPSLQDIAREMGRNVDPDRLFNARNSLLTAVGKSLGEEGVKRLGKLKRATGRTTDDIEAASIRALKNALLPLLVLAKVPGALEFTQTQFRNARNMTDKMASLNVLLHCQSDNKLANAALDSFYQKHQDNHLVVDKWFATQATLPGARGLSRINKLVRHEVFSLANPNRARSLLGTLAGGNMTALHLANGDGYRFLAEQVLKLDATNPQVAARLLTQMNNWKMFESKRRKQAKKVLQGIAGTEGLSRDLQEIVDRTLA
jgi:aminopeptidase N